MIILNENLPMSYTVVQMLPIITKNILIDAVENHVSSFQTEHWQLIIILQLTKVLKFTVSSC